MLRHLFDCITRKVHCSLFTVFLLITFILLPVHSYGDLEKSLKDLEEKQKTIEAWEADFIQTKVISLMSDKIVSEGYTAYKRPNLIHWRYTKGSNLLMVFNGHEAWLYYPNLREAERYKNIERMLKKFPLAYGLEIKSLRKYWDISLMPSASNGSVTLELRPKEKGDRRIFDRMILVMEEKTGIARKIQIFEPGGDNTIIEFKGIRLNEKLPDNLFIFKPPSGVRVTTPLEEK